MTKSQAAAYVFAQSIAAFGKIEGMKAENAQYPDSHAYSSNDFDGVATEYGITPNQIALIFKDCEEDGQ